MHLKKQVASKARKNTFLQMFYSSLALRSFIYTSLSLLSNSWRLCFHELSFLSRRYFSMLNMEDVDFQIDKNKIWALIRKTFAYYYIIKMIFNMFSL